MSRYYSYLNTAKEVVSNYKGELPLAIWLKQFFATRKQMGSRDRREVSSIVYQYYRLGKSVTCSFEERIGISLFLCRTTSSELLKLLKPEWNDKIDLPLPDKITLLDELNQLQIFPFTNEIQEGIDKARFNLSHLIQPDLFIRIRPDKSQQVKNKLQANGIGFMELSDSCLSISNATSLDTILDVDKEVVIQDYSSQQVADLLAPLINSKKTLKVWDCCAASGGKSIMAVDVLGNINLTTSDVRSSIIQNLRKRFERAGITRYQSFVADIATDIPQLKGHYFDLIICDAPCTGSGTWGRTPENLVHFKQESIQQFNVLQQKIVSHSMAHLVAGGYFLYITCSVFTAENEAIVAFIQQQFPQLQLVSASIIEGHKKRADTMYAALFRL